VKEIYKQIKELKKVDVWHCKGDKRSRDCDYVHYLPDCNSLFSPKHGLLIDILPLRSFPLAPQGRCGVYLRYLLGQDLPTNTQKHFITLISTYFVKVIHHFVQLYNFHVFQTNIRPGPVYCHLSQHLIGVRCVIPIFAKLPCARAQAVTCPDIHR
jgi:hypothetical protein